MARRKRDVFLARLIAHINRKKWWYVPPRDRSTYHKRGKFFASSFGEAEFWGRPLDEPERVKIARPLIGDEESIEKTVVRENDIAGEEPKNQQHPDRLSLMGSYQYKACNIVTGALEKTLKNQTDFSVGTMPKECAFCPETANLSAEHLWSDWMSVLFPGKKRFTNKNEHGEIVADWSSDKLDWKARVVCEPCNNTWMSEIETKHAQPTISNFIVGHTGPISQKCADSVALFAFKTAVVFDHIRRDREPFFSRVVRHGFRENFAIPATVRMFMAGFLPRGKGQVHSCYHEGALSPTDRITLYVCTYAVGTSFSKLLAKSNRDSPKLLYNHADQGHFDPLPWSFGRGFLMVLSGHPPTFCKRLTISIPFPLGGKFLRQRATQRVDDGVGVGRMHGSVGTAKGSLHSGHHRFFNGTSNSASLAYC